MAKLYREDLMIWKPEGGNKWYIIEREAAVKEGVRKAVFRVDNPWAVAEFQYREDAEKALLMWPSREEEAAQAAGEAAAADGAAGTDAGPGEGSGEAQPPADAGAEG